jgi:hypothetical protein
LRRFWIEVSLGAATGFLLLLTLLWRDWIEAISGFEPDRHDGSFEWMLVVGLGLATCVCAVLARGELRRQSLTSMK